MKPMCQFPQSPHFRAGRLLLAGLVLLCTARHGWSQDARPDDGASVEPPPDTVADYESADQTVIAAQFIDAELFSASDANRDPQIRLVSVGLGGVPTGDDISIAFGFDFLQPSWSNQSFQDLLPGNTAAAFPGLSLDSQVDHDFGLAPRLEVGAGIGDSNYGLSVATGFISLSGTQRQNLGTGTGNESLEAFSSINILSVNAPEVSYATEILDDSIIEFKVGTRYSSLNQNFSANLRRGNGQAVTTSSYQDFRGVGLTTALHTGMPLSDTFWLYTRSRGSILVGGNERQSNFTVVVPGGGAGTVTNSVSNSKTDIIPVGEFEVGLSWDNRGALDPDSDNSLMWLKVGYVAQIWGDVGLISSGTAPFFREGYLSLMGFTLQAGVQR